MSARAIGGGIISELRSSWPNNSLSLVPPGDARIAAQNRILTAGKAPIKMASRKSCVWDEREDKSTLGETIPMKVSGSAKASVLAFLLAVGCATCGASFAETPVNILTGSGYDPTTHTAELKVCTVRIEPL